MYIILFVLILSIFVIFLVMIVDSKRKTVIENKFIIISIGCTIFISVIIPVFLEGFIYKNNCSSMLNNSELASFLGSFLGGTFGGGITLIAMHISIKATRKDIERSEIIKSRSYIDIFIEESTSGTFQECKGRYSAAKLLCDKDYNDIMQKTWLILKNDGLSFIGIENVGPQIMKEFKVSFYDSKSRKKIVYLHRILVGETIFIPVLFENTEDVKCCINKIEIYCKTLKNEVLFLNKVFREDLSYEESTEYIDKMDYGYERKIVSLKDINI